MPDGLYEHDILAWSETQADLLRRLSRGERVPDSGPPVGSRLARGDWFVSAKRDQVLRAVDAPAA